MPVQICGHSQEFFALGETARTAHNPWDSSGHSGERGQVALRHKSHSRVPFNAHGCFLHRTASLLQMRLWKKKKRKVTREQLEFRNYNIN